MQLHLYKKNIAQKKKNKNLKLINTQNKISKKINKTQYKIMKLKNIQI